jgi:Septum formation
MTPPRLGRLLAVAGGVLAVALMASGCTSAHGATAPAGMPKVGDCWRVTYGTAVQSETWVGSAAVPCTDRHESYTYAVTKLRESFTGSWLDSNGNSRADVNTAAFDACLARQKALLPAITPKEALFYPTYYVPPVAQWNKGARWVRCDMTEIRVGSEVSKPSLTPLPPKFSDLMARLKAAPKKFALCENDVFNNGPDGASTTYADCTHPADWTFVVRLTLPGGATAAYPGTATVATMGAKRCAAVVTATGHDIVAKTPDRTAWEHNGDRAVDCWLNNN